MDINHQTQHVPVDQTCKDILLPTTSNREELCHGNCCISNLQSHMTVAITKRTRRSTTCQKKSMLDLRLARTVVGSPTRLGVERAVKLAILVEQKGAIFDRMKEFKRTILKHVDKDFFPLETLLGQVTGHGEIFFVFFRKATFLAFRQGTPAVIVITIRGAKAAVRKSPNSPVFFKIKKQTAKFECERKRSRESKTTQNKTATRREA